MVAAAAHPGTDDRAGDLGGRAELAAGLRLGAAAAEAGAVGGVAAAVLGLALAVHNQRVAVIAWAVSLGLFGLMYGSLLGEVEGFADKLGSTLEDVLGELMSPA